MNEEDRAIQVNLEDVLEAGEQLRHRAPASDSTIAVTDRRLIVADPNRIALAVPFERLRRIQFDIERSRPATLVVVPEHPSDEAQVLTVRPDQYEATAGALVAIGLELATSVHPDPAGQA
jgi:hypothetical protein